MENKKPRPPVRGLVVQQHNRKPLFGNARQTATTPNETRIPPLSRSKSSPATHDKPGPASPATPGGSRIPRFGSGGFGSRKPMSLAEAFKLAGEEDSSARPGPIDGSPSPAPRSWRKRQDEAMRMTLNEDPLDKRAVSPNKERIAMRNRVDDGIAPTRTSRWVLEEGMRDADALLPSTENVAPGPEASPEKSYAWQVDEDFTAGDLQVSDSPRIRVNNPPLTKRSESPRKGTTPNAKLEEIRARELGLTPNVASARRSTKLDDIRVREKEAEKAIPLERGFPRIGGGFTKLDDIMQRETQGLSKRAAAQAKLEEIKERNAMTRSVSPDLARRNWLGRGADIPRAKSAFEPVGRQVPDTPVTIYKSEAERRADDVRRAAAKKAEERETEIKNKAASRGANGLSPDKRDQSRELLRKLARAASASPGPERKPDEARRTTSVPPKPEAPRASSLKRSALADGSWRPSNTSSNASKSASSERPTVGFAGLARSRSSDSRKSKRSSVHSEQDPTDRIEAEERLFEPTDNQSEYGSVRAPSPWVDEEEERNDNDATPKPPSKQDFLSMPTPRAPGAFVDTPVTIKKEDRAGRRRLSLDQSPDIKPDLAFHHDKINLARSDNVKTASDLARSKNVQTADLALPAEDVETASDPGTAEEKPARPRRLSLPRRQPLTNSAKLPSVRDDLREIQRKHNIRDGTLDNLEDILLGKKTTNEELDLLLKEIPPVADVTEQKREPKGNVDAIAVKIERQLNVDAALDDELAAYEALSASVERDLGVHNGTIQVAVPGQTSETDKKDLVEVPPGQTKHSIDKTHPVEAKPRKPKQPQNELTKTDTETKTAHIIDEKHNAATCPLCVAPASRSVTYLHLPLPRLFHLSPHPRLTLLGLLLCALSVWCAAETAMCGLYCRPATCAGPCVWSFDDPGGFGAALPVKLDQWTTGGRGRAAWAAIREDVLDGLDGLWGVGDVRDMTTAQRRRHRRRMGNKTGANGMSREQKAKADAWRREREAGERARLRGGREEEVVGGDERLW